MIRIRSIANCEEKRTPVNSKALAKVHIYIWHICNINAYFESKHALSIFVFANMHQIAAKNDIRTKNKELPFIQKRGGTQF
jgi:hypothetical protein